MTGSGERRGWPGRLFRGWRPVAAVVFVGAGFLFMTSGLNSEGVDLRASSVTDLDTVLLQEKSSVDALQAHVAALNTQVNQLASSVNDKQVAQLQRKVDKLKAAAGFEPLRGPGVTVTLSDAPTSVLDSAVSSGKATADELVVHQQDIQAVVNALWLGGAEGITVQDQRIVSTTGIKCVGNTVVLHGVPYSPPYRISAVGDPVKLNAALNSSTYIAAYLTVAQTYQLGWNVETSDLLDLPAYAGAADLPNARVDTSASTSRSD